MPILTLIATGLPDEPYKKHSARVVMDSLNRWEIRKAFEDVPECEVEETELYVGVKRLPAIFVLDLLDSLGWKVVGVTRWEAEMTYVMQKPEEEVKRVKRMKKEEEDDEE